MALLYAVSPAFIIVRSCVRHVKWFPSGGAMLQRFGEKLRLLRQKHGQSQAVVAGALGLTTQSHVSYLERSKSAPSLAVVVLTAKHFAVAVQYLVDDALPREPLHLLAVPIASIDQLANVFGTNLHTLRITRNLKQAELTEQLGLQSQAHISDLERGEKQPSIELLLKCAAYFSLSVDQLLSPQSLV